VVGSAVRVGAAVGARATAVGGGAVGAGVAAAQAVRISVTSPSRQSRLSIKSGLSGGVFQGIEFTPNPSSAHFSLAAVCAQGLPVSMPDPQGFQNPSGLNLTERSLPKAETFRRLLDGRALPERLS